MSFLSNIFGDHNQRTLDKMRPLVDKINELEKDFERLSDSQLKEKTQEFRKRLGAVGQRGNDDNPSISASSEDSAGQLSSGNNKVESLEDILPEAFAAVREAAKRTIGQRHYDVQILGGIALHQGNIAEMKTGEGKTLASTLAVYLNALEGQGAHVVTVNDYLSKRDANWMGAIYYFLGLSVGCIVHDKAYVFEPQAESDRNEVTIEMQNLKEVPRKAAYEADVTYGTNNEFGFDYLRDNMVQDMSQMAQRSHQFAIVDECDSILIDEARTPLIISAPDMESTKLYDQFDRIIPHLKENSDYNIDEKMKSVTLTDEGIERVEKILGMDIYNEGGIRYVHHLEQALRAHAMFKRDRDYVVKDGEVIIVDDFTGRLMFGRRYSGGLHQAIEAKERVRVQQESRTLATITFQNYFRMYKKLAGMTGTALTNAEEFNKVYKLDVVVVPTNQPLIRQDLPDRIYRTEKGKFMAVTKEIAERYRRGQPVLVGTVSIEKNEFLNALLKKEGIPQEILNAKNHEKEAQIIAQAGRVGAVTVATNMAGRGVDIILGGRAGDSGDDVWRNEHDKVVESGGLCVIGTERHEARRIDNQLRGRAGRQGDPGSSQFFVSLEDDLMRIFGGDRIKRMMEAFDLPEDQPIENKIISRALESAQGKIEGMNFDIRKHVLEYDDVMNKQREAIYRRRKVILESGLPTEEKSSLKVQIMEMARAELKKVVEFHAQAGYIDSANIEEISEVVGALIPLGNEERGKIREMKDGEKLIENLDALAEKKYEEKEKELGGDSMRQVERAVMLRTIDMLWMDHLDNMDHLRDSVRLRAYGQRDPLVEYKKEGHRLFQQLLSNFQLQVVSMIYKVSMAPSSRNRAEPFDKLRAEQRGKNYTAAPPSGETINKKMESVNNIDSKNIGRNDPCPCGATHPDGRPKKYKHCCGK